MAHLRINTTTSFSSGFSLSAPSTRPQVLYPSPDELAVSPTTSPVPLSFQQLPPLSLSPPRDVDADFEMDDLVSSLHHQLPSLTESSPSRFVPSRRTSSVSTSSISALPSYLSRSSSSASSHSMVSTDLDSMQPSCPRSVPEFGPVGASFTSSSSSSSSSPFAASLAPLHPTIDHNRIRKQRMNGTRANCTSTRLRAISELVDRVLNDVQPCRVEGVHPSCLG